MNYKYFKRAIIEHTKKTASSFVTIYDLLRIVESAELREANERAAQKTEDSPKSPQHITQA